MSIEKKIVDFLLQKDLRLRFLEDQVFDLDESTKEEAIALLGEFEVVDCDERKKDRQCTETAIVEFKSHGVYIKELATGPCHYRDVMIDGLPDVVDYYTVEPIVTTTYGNEKSI
jgi:hypothetical protein